MFEVISIYLTIERRERKIESNKKNNEINYLKYTVYFITHEEFFNTCFL